MELQQCGPLLCNHSKVEGGLLKTQSKQQRGLFFCVLAHSFIYFGPGDPNREGKESRKRKSRHGA